MQFTSEKVFEPSNFIFLFFVWFHANSEAAALPSGTNEGKKPITKKHYLPLPSFLKLNDVRNFRIYGFQWSIQLLRPLSKKKKKTLNTYYM